MPHSKIPPDYCTYDPDNKYISYHEYYYPVYYPYPVPVVQYGWVCPKCGRVNAPWMPECPCYWDREDRTKTSADVDSQFDVSDDEGIYDIKCVKCGNVMKYDFDTRTYYCDCNTTKSKKPSFTNWGNESSD